METENNQKQKKSPVKALMISLIAGVAIGAVYAALRFDLSGAGVAELCYALSDACFVAGLCIAAVGLVSAISCTGGFDGIGYGVKSFSDRRKNDMERRYAKYAPEEVPDDAAKEAGRAGGDGAGDGEPKDYFEYCQMKKASRVFLWQPLAVGAAFFVAAVILGSVAP